MAQIVKAKPGIMIVLGKEGEHQARSVEFDLSEWRAVYGPGDVQLLVRRSGEELPYPVEITQEENRVVWTVNATELARPGMGYCKLRYYQGETLVKSQVWLTFVLDGVADAENPPAPPGENWLEQMLRSETAVRAAAEEAQQAGKAAQAARQAIENMTVSAETLEPGRAAEVQKSVEGGAMHLRYGLPRGENGKNAYDYAREAGYTGTEADFAKNLAATETKVDFSRAQDLTGTQKAQARNNIGVASPDWNQNDETAADYIRNRPVCTAFGEMMGEQTVSVLHTARGVLLSETETLSAGENYVITFDNVAYRCVAYNPMNAETDETSDCVFVGDPTWLDLSDEYISLNLGEFPSNGEPFAIAVTSYSSMRLYTQGGTHTVSISNETMKLDSRCLDIEGLCRSLPALELTASFADGSTQTYTLYGEAAGE